MNTYGLIGYPLTHSFSKRYFDEKFSSNNPKNQYKLFPIKNIEELPKVLRTKGLRGLNVTIPYKEQVIPYLDGFSPEADSIGAVNMIKVESGKSTGHNTDHWGFSESLKKWLDKDLQQALIFGSGGASKAIQYALNTLGISFLVVSRNVRRGDLTYRQLNDQQDLMEQYPLIINATPIGMYPKDHGFLDLPYEKINNNHYVYDLIYNPAKTTLLKMAEERGASIKNGYEMLVLQAEKAWEIWQK